MKRTLIRLALVALAGYLSLCAAMYAGQRSLLYHPDPTPRPVPASLPNAEEVQLKTTDGETLVAWHSPPAPGKAVVLFFHGNAGTSSSYTRRFEIMVREGLGLLAVNYRGYAGSTGTPTEAGLRADAQAAYQWLAQRYPPGKIIPFGHSLGTGVAVGVAANHSVGGLILEAPYTSVEAVAAGRFPFIPVGLLMQDRFRSDALIGRVQAPVLIVTGDLDRTIPPRMADELGELAGAQTTVVRLPNAGHDDVWANGGGPVILGFLQSR
jgi:uncharacterized protein